MQTGESRTLKGDDLREMKERESKEETKEDKLKQRIK